MTAHDEQTSGDGAPARRALPGHLVGAFDSHDGHDGHDGPDGHDGHDARDDHAHPRSGSHGDHAHPATDSAGNPWAGRTFGSHDDTYADDDGSADPALLAALEAFHRHEASPGDVLNALRGARLLIPLIAHAGDEGVNEHGMKVDKTQELAIVTVQGPDGRAVLPAFTSVGALQAWDPTARPVPVESRRAALAAASEHTQLMVLDPVSATEFGLRRPAVWALAQDIAWVPSFADREVAEGFLAAVVDEPSVASLTTSPGSITASLEGPELVVTLAVRPGLDQDALSALLGRLQQAWASAPVIAERVDSMAVRVVSA